jgi:Zn-dependent peptidase ImmA (M78 family)
MEEVAAELYKNYIAKIKSEYPWVEVHLDYCIGNYTIKHLENKSPKGYKYLHLTPKIENDIKTHRIKIENKSHRVGLVACYEKIDKIICKIFIEKDLRIHYQLMVLLHELGHCLDYRNQITLNRKSKLLNNITDFEQYAHRFVVEQLEIVNQKDLISEYQNQIIKSNYYPCPEWSF